MVPLQDLPSPAHAPLLPQERQGHTLQTEWAAMAAQAHVHELVGQVRMCACMRAWKGGAAVLTASLGTYKPCGRICLRCQLKAFSNPPPLQGCGGGGGARELRNPIQSPPSNQPSAQHRGTAGAGTTLFPGPASLLVGLKLKEEGSRCLASPSLGEGQEPCPL